MYMWHVALKFLHFVVRVRLYLNCMCGYAFVERPADMQVAKLFEGFDVYDTDGDKSISKVRTCMNE